MFNFCSCLNFQSCLFKSGRFNSEIEKAKQKPLFGRLIEWDFY